MKTEITTDTDNAPGKAPEQHRLPDGGTFSTPYLPTYQVGSAAHTAFLAAHAALDTAMRGMAAIAGDGHLSEAGKAAKSGPMQEAVWNRLAESHADLDRLEAETDRAEAALLAVPPVHDNAPTAAIEEREARDWWRAQPVEARAKLLASFENDEAEAGKFARLQLALLRSPIPLPDLEAQSLRELWNRARRLENPAETIRIGRVRDGIAWARAALAHVQGHAARATGWNMEAVTLHLAGDETRSKVARRFGVDGFALARAKARIDAKAGRATRI